jgi:hypothetical protein
METNSPSGLARGQNVEIRLMEARATRELDEAVRRHNSFAGENESLHISSSIIIYYYNREEVNLQETKKSKLNVEKKLLKKEFESFFQNLRIDYERLRDLEFVPQLDWTLLQSNFTKEALLHCMKNYEVDRLKGIMSYFRSLIVKQKSGWFREYLIHPGWEINLDHFE